jgi:hypothetical protein
MWLCFVYPWHFGPVPVPAPALHMEVIHCKKAYDLHGSSLISPSLSSPPWSLHCSLATCARVGFKLVPAPAHIFHSSHSFFYTSHSFYFPY